MKKEFTPLKYISRTSKLHKFNSAFTLAEVLITLGIIGIVAALTLPSLIVKHQKDVLQTKLKKFYSSINQAVMLSENENGDSREWGRFVTQADNLDWYNKYLYKYLKTVKVEEIDNNHTVGAYLPDGSLVTFSQRGNEVQYFPNAKDYKKCTDITYTSCSGIKYFNFQFMYADYDGEATSKYNKLRRVEPYVYLWDGTIEGLKNNSIFGCKEALPVNGRAYCTKILQLNDWKVPDDYPVNI